MSSWVVIPAYNEEKNIEAVLNKTKKYIKNIIIVDDGSSDKTYEIVSKIKEVYLLKHIVNMGKGITLRDGCDYAIKQGAQQIVVMDSDGQHDPRHIPIFLEKLKENDIVLGYRKINKKMPGIFRFGNMFINKTSEILFGIKLRDTQSGYRSFKAEAYKKIRWTSSDYSMESEMIMNIKNKRLKYAEIPIETIYKDDYKGTTVLDGIKIVIKMIIWRFFRC